MNRGEVEGSAEFVDVDRAGRRQVAGQQFVGKLVLQTLLDDSLQWSGTVGWVVAFLGEQIASPVGDFEFESVGGKLLFDLVQLQIDDLTNLFASQRMENDRLVDSVEELRQELAFENVKHLVVNLVFRLFASPPLRVCCLTAWK